MPNQRRPLGLLPKLLLVLAGVAAVAIVAVGVIVAIGARALKSEELAFPPPTTPRESVLAVARRMGAFAQQAQSCEIPRSAIASADEMYQEALALALRRKLATKPELETAYVAGTLVALEHYGNPPSAANCTDLREDLSKYNEINRQMTQQLKSK